MISRFFRNKTVIEETQVFLPADEDRLYVVGDIHGRFDLLRMMMAKIADDHDAAEKDGRSPRVVFLGDYIDRGDQSREVIDVISQCGDAAVFLKGNHEAALLAFLESPEANRSWLRYGGVQTLASYQISVPKRAASSQDLRDLAIQLRRKMGPHVELLETMPLSFRSGNVVCVHAGLDPADLSATDEDVLLWGRSDFVEAGGVEGVLVVHGHYDAPEPILTPRRICVDTGAYYSGRLSAARIDNGIKIITADVLDG